MKFEMHPVFKKHSNLWVSGFESLSTAVVDGKVRGISITEIDGTVNSIWRVTSFWGRLKFLLCGELTIRVLGERQPPLAVIVGDIFE